MTITDLRESDAHTYKFRFYTGDPKGKYTGEPGVTLSVTDLKVTVSDTDGGVKKLTCSSSCTLPNPTYTWYKNRQPVSQCESASCSVPVVSEAVNYSCAVKGSDLHSPPVYSPRPPSVSEIEFNGSVTLVCVSDSNPASSYTWFRKIGGDITQFGEGANLTLAAGTDGVFYCMAENQLGSSNSSEWTFTSDNRTSVYAASGVAVVLLLIFTAVFLWMRRRAAVTSREREESSGEGASAPVYDDVSTLAVTSDPSRAASSDDQDDVQYSTVHFSHSQTKDVPLYSAVQQSNSLGEEEEVQYAAVNTAKPRTAQNDETPIYSTVQKNMRR
ncbi:uncharacterized protein LOC118811757 isoform X1 [Colossoma macropomum]|uniref:uncharacterized protein LOC118811757 isoform X1 n=1 Tax=Colossoma macropomum TaxID=42526 RepID=UPI0018649042|nr:uncharacterized protein LOC118811757 isoform X1 [Colossoma macropomum]